MSHIDRPDQKRLVVTRIDPMDNDSGTECQSDEPTPMHLAWWRVTVELDIYIDEAGVTLVYCHDHLNDAIEVALGEL